MSTISLCMIVKNESAIIRNCLASVLPLIDYVLIIDTGSTDGTQQIIHEFLTEHKVKGQVIDEPWQDFAYNRTFALERLREVEDIDYALIMDADDLLVFDEGFDPRVFKLKMEQALYDIEIIHGDTIFHRPQIFSNRLAFSFKGVLHEYLEAPPGDLPRATAQGFKIQTSRGGARSQNPRKYQDDAALLESALMTETDQFLISRYTFYLAQSYKDCGEREKALAKYLTRADLGNWSEEIYVSLLEAGHLMAALERPFDEVIATWERANQTVPARAEALHAASRYCRDHGRNAEGQEFARRGLDLTPPPGALFVRAWVYDYAILDEFSVNAYWAGAYKESLDAALKLLAREKLPPSMVARVATNARFAAEKLPSVAPPNLGSFGAESLVDQHKLVAQRSLHSRVIGPPRVMIAILAKQKEPALPLYLECIEALDYPKESIVLYIRTNNNTDRTEQILRDWVERIGDQYAAVEFDASDVADPVEQFREHEWNVTRFKVLAQIRYESMRRALDHGCEFYFVADVDNFVRPATLRELVALDLPIASPLLRSIGPGAFYSNYHAEIDPNGYYANCDQYLWILNRHIRGVVEVPVVHCTYLVRADVIPQLTYDDASGRHEYVIFSDSARKAGIPQYIDNRQVYGYITFGEGEQHVAGGNELARALLSGAGDSANLVVWHATSKPQKSWDMPIYLINLDRSTERLAQFQQRNAHLQDVVRFPAVDGRALDREKLIEEGVIAPDCDYTAGALGCALSHVSLWKAAILQNINITIFEDDTIATDRFKEKAAKIISELSSEWDFIQWGYVFDPLFAWVDFCVSKAKLEFYDSRFSGGKSEKFQSTDFRPLTAIKLAHSFGTFAYSVSPKGARALLEYCFPLRKRQIEFPGAEVVTSDVGIDVAMCGTYPSMQAFMCIPPLVIHDDEQMSDRKAVVNSV